MDRERAQFYSWKDLKVVGGKEKEEIGRSSHKMDAKESYSDTESDSSTRCEIDDLPDHKNTFIYEETGSMAKETRDNDDEKKADAKDSRPAEEEEVKSSDLSIIEEAIDFCESGHFQTIIRDFKVRHAHKFLDLAESKTPNEEEQDLEYTEIFKEYNELIDYQLTEEFIKKGGHNGNAFYQACQDIVDGKFTVLFEEHEYQWFIDVIQGWMDYGTFVDQMCDLAKANQAMQRAMATGNVKVRGRR